MDFVALNALEMLSLRAIAWEYYVESYKKFLLRGDWFSYHHLSIGPIKEQSWSVEAFSL
jgi:hypothetical protein